MAMATRTDVGCPGLERFNCFSSREKFDMTCSIWDSSLSLALWFLFSFSFSSASLSLSLSRCLSQSPSVATISTWLWHHAADTLLYLLVNYVINCCAVCFFILTRIYPRCEKRRPNLRTTRKRVICVYAGIAHTLLLQSSCCLSCGVAYINAN